MHAHVWLLSGLGWPHEARRDAAARLVAGQHAQLLGSNIGLRWQGYWITDGTAEALVFCMGCQGVPD